MALHTRGTAVLTSVALVLAATVAHVVWTPPAWAPGAAVDRYSRFQEKPLLGLLGLDPLIVFGLVLSVPTFLALYVALRRAGETAVVIATALALLGTVLHLTSNLAFEMLS